MGNSGAIAFSYGVGFSYAYSLRTGRFVSEKKAIASKALEFINDGDTIFLEAGTTILYLAKIFPLKKVTVVTNSIDIVN